MKTCKKYQNTEHHKHMVMIGQDPEKIHQLILSMLRTQIRTKHRPLIRIAANANFRLAVCVFLFLSIRRLSYQRDSD